MTAKDKTTLENSANCFQTLYPEELEILSGKKTKLEYSKGEQIFKQGAFAPYVMFIIDGLVKISLQTGFEKQINIRIAKSGEFLAFSSVYGDNKYNYTTSAIRKSKVCMIDKIALEKLLHENAEFALRITSKNYKNENRLYDIIKNLSSKQMRGKLASTLIYIASPDFAGENIFTLLSRHDLADFASISTESAIKILKEFEAEKIIELKGKDIIILKHKKLEEICERA